MEIKIYYGDTDCGGVVYYGNYLKYFEAARTEWLAEKGVSIKKLMEDGIFFVVASAGIKYHAPARYGDNLRIITKLTEKRGVRMNFSYEVLRGDILIVTGETLLACVGSDFRPRKLPENFNKIDAADN